MEEYSSSSGGRSGATRRRLEVTVPEGSKPGTALKVRPSGDFSLTLTVPPGARAGDKVVLTEQPDGEWEGKLIRKGKERRIGEVRVPPEAAPGKTELPVDAGPAHGTIMVKVPAGAQPYDILRLTVDDDDSHFLVKLVRGVAPGPQQLVFMTVRADKRDCFAAMKEAAHLEGAYVNPKLARGLPPDIDFPGIITLEPLEVGEILFEVPAGLHISPATCSQVMPLLYDSVLTLDSISPHRQQEAALTACVAAVLLPAIQRHQGRSQPELDLGGLPQPLLWRCYATALLGEDFDSHPQWRAMQNFAEVHELLSPSWEAPYSQMLAFDAVALCDTIASELEHLATALELHLGRFLQARLCLLTREFGTPRGSALVPLVDFCNHSAFPGAQQTWDFQKDSMVVRAMRPHAPREEVLISYGPLSNPVLFRTYGFTCHPEVEPAWTCAVQAADLISLCQELGGQSDLSAVQENLKGSFPPMTEVHLDSRQVTETLETAFGAWGSNRKAAVGVLLELCQRLARAYENDASLAESIQAWRTSQRRQETSSAWWVCEKGEIDFSGRAGEALKVKMSEYLCLQAHVSALQATVVNEQSPPLQRALHVHRPSLEPITG